MKYLGLVMMLLGTLVFAQNPWNSKIPFDFNPQHRGQNAIRIGFYNVENLFDTQNDSLINDEGYLPESMRHWTYSRYQNKLRNISQTIVAIGGWEPIAIMGLCEIENQKVLEDLVRQKSFGQNQYHIIHSNSPDRRGIDVALLFLPHKVQLDTFQYISIPKTMVPSGTRDLLYVQFTLINTTPLHIFVAHYPSRYGGALISEPKRVGVSQIIKLQTDSILQADSNAIILIMGDFNDTPTNQSMQVLCDNTHLGLINLMANFQSKGTHKYHGHWSCLDQILVSPSLTSPNGGKVYCSNPTIFSPDFLLEKDMKYLGFKPKRSYHGFKYVGGYSDHLPIFLDLHLVK